MIKKKLLNILKEIIDWLAHYHLKFSRKKNEIAPYNSLSPTDNAENIDYYTQSLNWALSNRNKIKNIAISGSYGSGKSSVIQTFQKRNKNKNVRFLNISLATFKEINTDKPIPENEELLRLIELSILQQFFYHEKDDKIPDSRFKKIKSQSKWFLRFQTISLISFLISFLYLVFPKFLAKFSLIEIKLSYQSFVHYSSVIIFIIGLLFIFFKVTRIIKSIVIKKLSINNASIEIDNSISKSILNNHLDEILYFFEVTKYNTVIIEDIDRFEQTEVFTKLRELNLLINNSKKTKENIVFIYAIRDDMFKDKERTKFFDFMIPIIPVINFSNSSEKLLKIIEKNGYGISKNLISDISLFIDDMRLLFNIMNEYHIYSNSLDNNLNQDKLLSMIVYKNMHPIDFTDLSNNKGSLYSTVSNKQHYIKEKSIEIDEEIIIIRNKIEILENYKQWNLKELRTIYLSKIVEKINNSSEPFYRFKINQVSYNFNQSTEDDVWEEIVKENDIQYQCGNHYNYIRNSNISVSKIENEVNRELTYKDREGLILNNDKIIEELKNKIEDFEENKNQIKKYKIKELLSNKLIKIENVKNINESDKKQQELINILLRNGYIDEDYLNYISIFYEGSLSKTDYQFLINVKTQKNSEFDFKLNKIENLIEKINLLEFEKIYILNYSLLDYLLSNNKYELNRNLIISQLNNESKESINFIDGYIDYSSNIELFIKTICEKWNNIWGYIENESNYSKEKKEKYFKLIIEHADTNDIKNIFDGYKSIISEDSEFLNLLKNENKLKDIIKTLDIKFNDITDSSPKELLEFIYSKNYYSINIITLKNILKFYEFFNEKDFNEKNYTIIQQTKIKTLIEYVDNNINDYITFVYLKIEQNKIEPLDSLLSLLNNQNISIENKEKIIKQSETRIEDIGDIDDIRVINLLLREFKISVNWDDILYLYAYNQKNKFSESLVYFMNNNEIAKELSKNKIDKEHPDEETAKAFIREILLEDKFNNDSYGYLLKSVPYIYSSLSFEHLSLEKIELLIENKILIVNYKNFKLLKENFDDFHISLIEEDTKKFIKEIDTFELDNSDILCVLKSEKFNINQKVEFIKSHTETIFTTEIQLLNQIGFLLISNLELQIEKEIINSVILKSNLKNLDKIKIFNKYNSLFNNDEIELFIISLGEPYSNISEKGKRPLIEFIESNEYFLKILVRKKYISKYEIEKKGIRISTFRKKVF
ncbi:YobI family P-loop NTPase [Tenacibaculum finnmarkense]|uniref:YobI family P-loop NTPase n=1 Tax=Tenacibaculum finnmarkense TaxID=2781243 RepID=UPI001E436CC0|nr:hypothetical protein [Tenacibaculum finnmarkense]MCD8399463.1 hypothetical protein [Tenacibaculum finnmarkense genomovar ulcerans]